MTLEGVCGELDSYARTLFNPEDLELPVLSGWAYSCCLPGLFRDRYQAVELGCQRKDSTGDPIATGQTGCRLPLVLHKPVTAWMRSSTGGLSSGPSPQNP